MIRVVKDGQKMVITYNQGVIKIGTTVNAYHLGIGADIPLKDFFEKLAIPDSDLFEILGADSQESATDLMMTKKQGA